MTEKEYFPPQPDEDKQGYVYRKLAQLGQDVDEIGRKQSVAIELQKEILSILRGSAPKSAPELLP